MHHPRRPSSAPARLHARWALGIVAVGLGAFLAGRWTTPGKASAPAAPRPADHAASDGAHTAGADAAPPAPSGGAAAEARWRQLLAQPPSASTEGALAGSLEAFAQQDAARALGLALAPHNLRLRAHLVQAVLRGWARVDPTAAAAWVTAQSVIERTDAVAAVLHGAIATDEGPARALAEWRRADPSCAAEDGSALVAELATAGQFERAVDFASAGGPTDREAWLNQAYTRWAEFQPAAAAERALGLADPAMRERALNGVVTGWSRTDPAALIEFASERLPAAQQCAAIASAVSYWASVDPVNAATWLGRNDPGPAADTGIAQIALSPQLATAPRIAARWAENIANAQLRFETMKAVLAKWPADDADGARRFLATLRSLGPDERAQLSAQLAPAE